MKIRIISDVLENVLSVLKHEIITESLSDVIFIAQNDMKADNMTHP